MSLTKAASIAVAGLALAMLALMVIPADAWRAPKDDAVYTGFDPNLMATTGSVRVTQRAVDASASAPSGSTITLATTLRQRLEASLDVVVPANSLAEHPFRIGVWSPWTASGFFVVFGPAPDRRISVETVTGGDAEATLIRGKASSMPLGRYEPGKSYRTTFLIDRAAGSISANVSGDGVNSTKVLASRDMPPLFGHVQFSITASGDGPFELRKYMLSLPHERSWASKVDDPLVNRLITSLALLGLLAVAAQLLVLLRQRSSRRRGDRLIRIPWLAMGAAIVYVAGNALLFPLGSHPFDFSNEQLYAYVARTYGTAQLYFLPDVTTSHTSTWNGVPWIEAAFPYQPVIAYLFAAIGWISTALFAGAGVISRSSDQLGYVIKSVNVIFGLADAVLIYFILRQLDVSERWSRIGGALFLFNPAVWFSMSIWGQTHVISIFFVLVAILFALRRMPFWAWVALTAAVLTRPQMVVFGLLLGVVFLRQLGWRTNIAAISWTVIVTFVALVPLTLATSPSLPIDIMVNNLRVQEAGGNQATLTTVSQSAYSIWPLVTYAFHGVSGAQRAFTPSSERLLGSLSYQTVSQIVTALAMLVVTAALVFRKRYTIDSGGYLPLVAVGVTSFLMLLTGVVATHFLLALPLLLLCRRWMDSIAYCYVVAIWSISTFVPMFGDMGIVIGSKAYPLLAPDHNLVTRFFVALYSWDRFITVAIVANIGAVIWLAWLSVRPSPRLGTVATPVS